jgi:acyl-CoA reductase-like NAD-dependent aldehyde dehydrogenase
MATTTASVQLHKSVQEFVSQPRRLLIGGEWVEAQSGKTFATYNPATGEVLARVAEGDREDISLAVTAARKAFESGPWPDMPPAERGRLLWKLSDLIEQHHEELAELETLDNGKPIFFSRIVDIPSVVNAFRYMAGWAQPFRFLRPMPSISLTLYANRLGLLGKSFHGIFHLSWRRGSLRPRSPWGVRAYSSPPSKLR